MCERGCVTTQIVTQQYVQHLKKIWQNAFKLFFQDFCLTVIVAVFWLSASAAWANGVINLKYIADPNSWIFRNTNLVK